MWVTFDVPELLIHEIVSYVGGCESINNDGGAESECLVSHFMEIQVVASHWFERPLDDH